MTHVPEEGFTRDVRDWLEQHFVHVEYNKTLPETGRRPDFIVSTPFDTYVIEVENDFEAAYKGIGQVVGYAAELDAIPVIVLPSGHIEEPEFSYIQQYFDTRFDDRHVRFVTINGN